MTQKMAHVTWFLAAMLLVSGCGGNKAFTKGEYDDPTRVELLDDKFNESDMQQMAQTVIQGLSACRVVQSAKQPPVVIVETVQNRTEEHIDMTLLTDKVRTSLIKSGKFRFVNKEERGTLQDEYGYNESGNVSRETKKTKGKQIGADYILSGRLGTNIQQVGNEKFVYYKLTANLTNMETSAIDCTEDKEVRKKYTKKRVGM